MIKKMFPNNYIDLLSVTDINHWSKIVENESKIKILLFKIEDQ
jgi:hypothetical protein